MARGLARLKVEGAFRGQSEDNLVDWQINFVGYFANVERFVEESLARATQERRSFHPLLGIQPSWL